MLLPFQSMAVELKYSSHGIVAVRRTLGPTTHRPIKRLEHEMKKKIVQQSIQQAYEKRHEDIHFDKSQLFEVIDKTYHPKNVLYPGCSIHHTPAFYFPRITFVDTSNETIQYVSALQEIRTYVNKKKHFRQKSQLQKK